MAAPHRLDELLADAVPARFVLNSPRSVEVCRRHGILPEELYPRTLESFATSKNDMAKLVERRYEHFNTRRLEKLRFLVEERDHLIAHAGGVSPVPYASRLPDASSVRRGSPSPERLRLRDEERVRKLQEKARLDAAQEALQRQRVAEMDERAAASIAAMETRHQLNAQRQAEARAARQEQVLGTQKVMTEQLHRKKDLLAQRDAEHAAYLDEKRRIEEDSRLRLRDAKAARAAEARARREEQAAARRAALRSRIDSKQARVACHEEQQTAQQQHKQVVQAERQRMTAQKVSTARNETDRRSREQAARLKGQRPRSVSPAEQDVRAQQAAAALRRREEVLERRRAMDEMQRAQAVAKVESKEARAMEATEQARQKQIWDANERHLRQLDAQEAVERQKRKAAYETQLRERALQDKILRLNELEEARWATQPPAPGSSRRGYTSSPRGSAQRAHSAGATRR